MPTTAFPSLGLVMALLICASCEPADQDDGSDAPPPRTTQPGDGMNSTDDALLVEGPQPPGDRDEGQDVNSDKRSGEYRYPPFSAAIEVMESMPPQYAATISVTAPTGGWKLTLDRTELVGGILRAYLTLEKPADDEIVTQALVTHTERHRAGTEEIASVEVYVKRVQRGRDAENEKAEYQFEARAP